MSASADAERFAYFARDVERHPAVVAAPGAAHVLDDGAPRLRLLAQGALDEVRHMTTPRSEAFRLLLRKHARVHGAPPGERVAPPTDAVLTLAPGCGLVLVAEAAPRDSAFTQQTRATATAATAREAELLALSRGDDALVCEVLDIVDGLGGGVPWARLGGDGPALPTA